MESRYLDRCSDMAAGCTNEEGGIAFLRGTRNFSRLHSTFHPMDMGGHFCCGEVVGTGNRPLAYT